MRIYDKKKGKPLNWFKDKTEGEADDLALQMATPTPEEIELYQSLIVPQLKPFLEAGETK